jgi:glycerophosphoryl diester phosphodiesterase
MPDGKWLDTDDVRIHDLSLEQLQSYDIGRLRSDAPYGDQFPDQAVIAGETVPTLDDIAAMIALGVDGIITDYPGRAQRRLLAHDMDWHG